MIRRARIPATRRARVLYVLPTIPDELAPELKSALAIRNACTVEGVCPACGAAGELLADDELEDVWHLVFRHEPECGTLTDDEAAA